MNMDPGDGVFPFGKPGESDSHARGTLEGILNLSAMKGFQDRNCPEGQAIHFPFGCMRYGVNACEGGEAKVGKRSVEMCLKSLTVQSFSGNHESNRQGVPVGPWTVNYHAIVDCAICEYRLL